MIETDVLVEKTSGNGRAFVILTEKNQYNSESDTVFFALEGSSKVSKIITSVVGTNNWEELSHKLLNTLSSTGNRQISLVAFGDTTALAQNIYLREPKYVRSMIIIDGSFRPHPTAFTRFVDWLEERFPLGLPLRSAGKEFNASSHLQRIRCPVLQLTTSNASSFQISEAKSASLKMPTSWYAHVEDSSLLSDLISDFQNTPAKCPQKNRSMN